ncbi:MAG: aldehyde dehydrogenase family protein, partial [Alphaproteobacteria bacterium]
FMKRFLALSRNWRTGDPLDPANNSGALIDSDHCAKVSSYLKGRTPLMGGEIDGNFITPTIFDDVKNTDKLATDEIFGPIVSIITVSSIEQAIEVANDTDYGLAASVFSANGKKALRAARAIKAGTVTINCYGEGDITTPFGGFKQSGFGGRDNGVYAHEQYTELKTIWIDLSDKSDDGVR